ncbi:MAG: Xaa-Pro peptidase family protein [Thermoanaerobaculia bacterium]|nr:Xaa-Pro peptidase family protein [Thermoanaerobaculia bacterium]
MLDDQIPAIQDALQEMDADGWLFACFQKNDPISFDLLGLDEDRLVTRRCYYLIPRGGDPKKLNHRLEPWMLDHLPGEKSLYLSWREHATELGRLVEGRERLVAQYSPDNQIPSVSRLDAGTADFLRGLDIELLSSADLVQRFAATWSPEQIDSHRRAAGNLHDIVHAAFASVGEALRADRAIDEYTVQRFILEQFAAHQMISEADPIVAVNEHAADPHYQPGPDRTSPIEKGDFLLIDLWAKEERSRSVYADITWCGVCASAPTDRQEKIWRYVADARDAALGLIRGRYPDRTVRGYEVDDAARQVIVEAGYGDRFIHRTGHSLGIQDHGQGANMDNLETHDTRPLIPNTGFSIEPGIYIPNDLGIRSEINVLLTPDEVEVTGGDPQEELLRLL